MSIDLHADTLSSIFIANIAKLRSIAFAIVGRAELADEITQDAYLRLTVGAYQAEKPYSYCCQVVRNLARDYYRRQVLESTYFVEIADGEIPPVYDKRSPEKTLHEHRLLDAIEQTLSNLPARVQLAFELHRLAGLTQREVAQQLGCSTTLVNFMLKDAHCALEALCLDAGYQ